MELKTWKDLHCVCKPEAEYCPVVKGREYAINWIKDIEATKELLSSDPKAKPVNDELIQLKSDYCIHWIKHFFDIKEEEL